MLQRLRSSCGIVPWPGRCHHRQQCLAFNANPPQLGCSSCQPLPVCAPSLGRCCAGVPGGVDGAPGAQRAPHGANTQGAGSVRDVVIMRGGLSDGHGQAPMVHVVLVVRRREGQMPRCVTSGERQGAFGAPTYRGGSRNASVSVTVRFAFATYVLSGNLYA